MPFKSRDQLPVTRNFSFCGLIRRTVPSGVACMYACMLEHPHHFDKKRKRKKRLDTISLRATSRSSVRLAPKIPTYVIHDLNNDIIRFKSSRGIIASITYDKVIIIKKVVYLSF